MSEVNKIANYNQMMSWLTRPSVPKTETREDFAIGGGQFEGTDFGTREGFSKYSGSNYVKKLVTPEFLKASGTSLQDLTAAERKLFREGDLFFTKMKGKGGKVGVNFFGDSQKIDTLLGTVPDDISNLPDELSGKSVTAQKIRKRFIEEYLKELPKGDVINLDATTRMLDEKISEATNGKIRMKDKTALQNFLNDKKLNTNKVRGPKNVAEAKDIQMKKYPSIDKFDDVQKQADELNAKYKLDDKGIKFMARETSTGKVGMRLSFTGEPFRNTETTGGRSLDAAPTAEGISKLETELKEIIKTDAFKNYSAKEGSRKGSVAAGSANLKYNQPELFEYLLNKEGPISKQQVIKDFKKLGYDEGVLRKAVGNLHANMYRALDPASQGGQFLSSYDNNQIKNVLDKVKNNFSGDFFNRTFENLLVDAYGDVPKKYKPLADKLKKFRELQKELRKAGVADEFIAQLDHVIPFNFLQLVREGVDPDELIRVKAYPGKLNSQTFKGAIDGALGRAVENKDKKLIKTITELRNFLPEDMGKISSDGKKIIDYKAKPFNLKTIYSDQQKKFGEVYKRTQEFIDNPKVIDLLKDAGISLKAISQLKRLNVPGFLKTFNDLKQSRPDLFVKVENEFSDIENQYASLNTGTMSDVSPVRKEQEPENVPAEAIAAGTVGATKYGPQILKALKNVGNVGLKTVGSLPAAGTFAGMTIKENLDEGKNIVDATVDPLVGLELLLPETVKKLGPLMARAARVSTPVGATITGLGTLKDRTLGMMEAADALTMQDYQEDLVDEYAAKRYRGYELGGRVGFADGPEDPDKRKFMKIMGGLASIPILGRFIDIGTQAPKVAEVVKRTAEGVPAFLTDLIAKVKLKATEKGTKYFTGNRSDEFADVYQADNFVVTEKGNKTTIREVDDPDRPGYRENQIEIEVDPETGGVTYNEASARPDMDGKLKDVDEYIEDDDLENMRKYTYDK